MAHTRPLRSSLISSRTVQWRILPHCFPLHFSDPRANQLDRVRQPAASCQAPKVSPPAATGWGSRASIDSISDKCD